MKKSIFLCKTKELNIESILYNEQINNKLENLQNDVKAKIEKAKKNENELNILCLKNKNWANDKIIQKQIYTTKKDGIPISTKSLYTGKVSSLKEQKILQKANQIHRRLTK